MKKTRKQRRKFTSEFKTQVALAALKERETLSELSKRFDLHPNQISKWKQEFLSKANVVFSNKEEKTEKKQEVDIEKLYTKIGQLEMEKEFLKKNLKKHNLL
ncbi:MAG: transposase [Bacteroidales bacterium]|nr:transposase [Bacteroidales bacterium]